MKKIYILLFAVIMPTWGMSQKQIEYGKASFYANKYEGRTTASGEKYWHSKLTAAHRTLPFNTPVKVTNLENNQTVVVRINDRGPFVKDRLIDLSKSAARKLDFIKAGIANVKIEILNTPTSTKKNEPIVSEIGTGKISSKNPISERGANIEPRFYEINVKEQKPVGYGVQLASYKEMVNLLERVKTIQEQLKEKVTIQVTSVNEQKVYRIVAGQFDNRIKAERYKEEIRSIFPGCFIFKF